MIPSCIITVSKSEHPRNNSLGMLVMASGMITDVSPESLKAPAPNDSTELRSNVFNEVQPANAAPPTDVIGDSQMISDSAEHPLKQ